jgi:GNAT superfamily N-acetyltransferase
LSGKQQQANLALRPTYKHQLQAPQFRGNSVQLQTVTGSGATGGVQLLIDPIACSGTIINLLVGQEHRGQGVGTKLMHAVVAQAKLHGLSNLSLEARSPEPGFPAAQLVTFYRKLGFHDSGPALRGGSKMSLPLGAPRHVQHGLLQAKRSGLPVFAPIPRLNLVQAKRAGLPVFAPTPRLNLVQAERAGLPVFAPIPRLNLVQAKRAGLPVFAPVPRLGFGGSPVLQRAAVATVDVKDLRFTQASVSPTFSSVPDKKKDPANLDASAAKVKKSGVHPNWLQNLSVFKLTHDDYGSNVYTLDNRRAYVLQQSALQNFIPQWANLETVYNNLFKFSTADDSKSIKLLSTKAEPVAPNRYTMIGEFVVAILAGFNVVNIAALPPWGDNSAATLAQVVADFHFNQ